MDIQFWLSGLHERVLADMPALVDALRTQENIADDEEAMALLAPYAYAFLHMVVCEECRETFRLTLILARAEERGEIKPPKLPD